jgi:hypothetical protein
VKATEIFKRQFEVTCKGGKTVVVFMDLYKLPKGYPKSFPEGYKFSWIAYDPDDESAKVLFDCHPPKGPHVHVDNDKDGEAFDWKNLDDAYELFFAKVREKFGDFNLK